MSTNALMWRPTPADPPASGALPDRLATLLATWLREQDAWSWDPKPLPGTPVQLDHSPRLAGFLEGLAATGIEGASELLANLEQHGTLDLWWE